MNEVIIEFNDLGFQYRAQAKPTLYNINLKIRKGEKILIAGPSGCGKSTMASLINGLIPFSYKGEISGSLLIVKSKIKTEHHKLFVRLHYYDGL